MTNRREFMGQILLASLAVCARSGAQGPPPKPVKSKPDVILFEGKYPGWPWVCAGADGTLYCVFREGTIHDYSAAGRAMFTKSADKGKTWTPATVIADAPQIDDRNVAIVELPGKELLVCYNTYTEPRESAAITVRSTDGGQTWSKPEPTGIPNTRTRSASVALADGTVLLPLYTAPGNGSVAALSKDRGHTWSALALPDAEGFVGDEWSVLEVEPGRLIGISRNNHPSSDGVFWQFESRDNGQTWSAPRRTNVRSKRYSSPAQITRHNNTPTLIYSDARMVSVSAVKTADPDFVQWDIEHRLPCYQYNADGSPIPDGSYPASVQTGPDERLIVDYEIRESGPNRIAGYFVQFPEGW